MNQESSIRSDVIPDARVIAPALIRAVSGADETAGPLLTAGTQNRRCVGPPPLTKNNSRPSRDHRGSLPPSGGKLRAASVHAGKRPHIHFIAAGFVRVVGDPSPVRRDGGAGFDKTRREERRHDGGWSESDHQDVAVGMGGQQSRPSGENILSAVTPGMLATILCLSAAIGVLADHVPDVVVAHARAVRCPHRAAPLAAERQSLRQRVPVSVQIHTSDSPPAVPRGQPRCVRWRARYRP